MATLRSSTRLRTKVISALATAGTSSSNAPSKAKPKRRKTAHTEPTVSNAKAVGRRTKGVRGKLKLMTEMPLDILFETFSHLQPADLLHLSRACKSLHDMLWKRGANHVWKKAFLNIERNPPPAMPANMIYPHYALLLFGTDCHDCGSGSTTLVHWAEHLRLCVPCIDNKSDTLPPSRLEDPDWSARALCPVWPLRKPGQARQRYVYLKDALTKVIEELAKLKDDHTLCEEFRKKQKVIYNERMEFARMCHWWEVGQKQKRKADIQDLRAKRREAMCERLRKEDWDPELKFLGPQKLENLPGADKIQALTDKSWANIHDEVIAFLEEIRSIRLAKERKELVQSHIRLLKPLYTAYIDSQPRNLPHPGLSDLCGEAPFRELIFSTPATTKLTQADFEVHKDVIPAVCTAWVTEREKAMEALLPPDCPSLHVAAAFFRCNWCTEPISFPRVLGHRCLLLWHDGFTLEDGHADLELGNLLWYDRPWNWGGEQVEFDEEAAGHAKDIISACGADPEKVTKEEMDALDYRVECLRCAGKRAGRLAMRWSMAIVHEIEKHFEEEWEGPKWKLVEDVEERALVKAKEEAGPNTRHNTLGCKYCGRHTSLHGLFSHLRHQ
ncbi:hypothetical protein DXG01_008391 [Tephrocybe rancida]|nr:hypothetical protein DXG01_008391 [Tephrocybe rancida]